MDETGIILIAEYWSAITAKAIYSKIETWNEGLTSSGVITDIHME